MSGGDVTTSGDPALGTADLHFKITWEEDQATIAVSGEVDLATAPRLSAALEKITGHSPRRVEVDLSGTSFFACRGLSVLMATRHRLADRGAELAVHGASRRVRRVFTASGLDGLLSDDDRDHTVVPQPRFCDDDSEVLQDHTSESMTTPSYSTH